MARSEELCVTLYNNILLKVDKKSAATSSNKMENFKIEVGNKIEVGYK